MMIIRNILIGFVLSFTLYLSLTRHSEIKRMLDGRRKKRIIDVERYEKGLKPEMRDTILRTR